MPLAVIILLALSINLPLGYLRSRSQPGSWRWFLWVHLSVPLLAACRILAGLGLVVIPAIAAAAILGQLLGGRFGQG